MREFVAAVASNGRITLPVEVRRHLGVSEGGKLVFVIDDDGHVRVKLSGHLELSSIVGSAGKLDQPLSKHEMLAIAYEDRALAARKLR